MKIFIEKSAKNFYEQLKFTEQIIDIKLSDTCEGAISLSAEQGDKLCVIKNGSSAKITYSFSAEFFRGILILLNKKDENDFIVTETSRFKNCGIMVDNSRNAVMNVERIKKLIAQSALLGYDNIQLYNEDTFEVDNQPYFGHLRMGYTQAEVKALAEFGEGFGIDIIPCIQTLAHLNQIFQYPAYSPLNDTADILLCGDENVYAFIEDVIASWRKCVKSERIHIGMDEAHNVGRGKYLDKNGLKTKFEILSEHLNRVNEICKKYGFKPMMWSDMFMRDVDGNYHSGKPLSMDEITRINKDVTLVYWDYYTNDKAGYDVQFERHLQTGNNICFAGGAWKWGGFLPQIIHSLKVSERALHSAVEHGIDDVFVTAWGDNGAEASFEGIMPVICQYAEMRYHDDDVMARIDDDMLTLTGVACTDACIELSSLDFVRPTPHPENPSKYLLYNDLLLGKFDSHIGDFTPEHCKKYREKYESLAKLENNKSAYVYETAAALAAALELKCDMGVRIYNAYHNGDKAALNIIANEQIPEMICRVQKFKKLFKAQWFKENKRGGFEIQDARLGGLVSRFDTVREILNDYLGSKIEKIEELERPILPFIINQDGKTICANNWSATVSPNVK
ncbi:MAG: beta-N-acetylhexosaminidase [Ruminococcaceae bacterium]|nr:beta-N-acetylhexosaminidase [Oscillospiraceae bacterium]